MDRTLAIILAGGAGERLHPLTRNLAKPAVPFGGIYRIIDFTLSNCLNSGIRKMLIMTQHKSLELNRHIRQCWNIFSPALGEFIEILPPMRRVHHDWYLGTADAVYQNIASIEDARPRETLVLSSDHIYKMDFEEMQEWHHQQNADLTVATLPVPLEEVTRFGVCEINEDYRIVGFEEKPQHSHPVRSVFDPDRCSVSMGIYIFDTKVLLAALRADADDEESSHDFGRDVIPKLLSTHRVVAYNFRDLNDKPHPYWRDIGTLDSYYDANMDLVDVVPQFNLYDERWPMRTAMPQAPPAKFVFAQEGRRMGVALDSIVSPGVIVSGGRVVRSVLSPGVRVNSYCEIDSSILLSNVKVGRYCRIRRAIVDSGAVLPENTSIGYDRDADLASGHTITESGIVVVTE